MLTFELPAAPDGERLLAAAIGSCRVTNPIYALAKRGDLKIGQYTLQATHSAAEALQSLRFVAGELEIPDRLCPYIFDTERSPSPTTQLARALGNDVDTFVLEISDDNNFLYRDICLQQNFFSINFIRPHGAALLAWFREVCGGRPIDEACIGAALAALKDGGHRHDDEMADLLRNIRYERQSEEEIAQQLGAMVREWGGRWIVVGAFEVPDYDGAVMDHRREMNQKLANAASQCGAVFYDPSALVREYGKATALDGGGADIYEYAPAFYPTVGETLVSLMRGGRPGVRRPAEAGAHRQAGAAARSAVIARARLADEVNAELADLHRGRLAALGVVASGLGPHYQGHLERGTLVGERELGTLELIVSYLPPYEAYAVMRAGVGELALLLAANGQRTIAYEPYPARRAAVEAGRSHLEAAALIAPGLLTIVPSLTPDGPLRARVLGIGLDVAHVRTEADALPHFARLAAFEALLIDLRAFLRLRADGEERDFAVDRLYELGFTARRDYGAERLSWFHRK